MEEKIREETIRSISKEVVGCLQYIMGKKKVPVQFEDTHNRDIIDSLLSYLFEKEEVVQEVDETVSDLPKIGQSGFLTTDGYPV